MLNLIPAAIVIDELCQIIVKPFDGSVPRYFSRHEIMRVTDYYEDDTWFVVIEPNDRQMACFISQITPVFYKLLRNMLTTECVEFEHVDQIRDSRHVVPQTMTVDHHCQLVMRMTDGEEVCFTKSEIRNIRVRHDSPTHQVLIDVFDDTFPAYVIDTHPMFEEWMSGMLDGGNEEVMDVENIETTDDEVEEVDAGEITCCCVAAEN